MPTLFPTVVATPVLIGENRGSLEKGEQIRWRFEISGLGTLFTLQVDEGEVVLYTSTVTTAPSPALHQHKIQTSSSKRIYLNPSYQPGARSLNRTASAPVYMTLVGLGERNTFTLSKGKV